MGGLRYSNPVPKPLPGHTLLLRMNPADKERLKVAAAREQRSMANLVVHAAMAYLDAREPQAAGPAPLAGEPPRTGGPALPVVVTPLEVR